MKNPQVLSFAGPSADSTIAIWGEYIIDATTQLPITSPTTLKIDINLFDVTSGSNIGTAANKSLIYDSTSTFWYFAVSDLSALLTASVDRHKFVAKISKNSGESTNLKTFYLDEFAVDNNSFEETLMRLPFEVKGYPTDSDPLHIVWSDVIGGTAKYKAPAYEGGSGVSTPATDPSRVTHRGAIVAI